MRSSSILTNLEPRPTNNGTTDNGTDNGQRTACYADQRRRSDDVLFSGRWRPGRYWTHACRSAETLAPPDGAEVFVKLEYFNPTGSYKDRMALAMIEGAEARGALRPGMRVVESCRRQHGSSQAMVCAVKGHEFVPLSSDAFAERRSER